MTDNLELENLQEPEQVPQISVDDVLEKKVDYHALPKDERDRLLYEYQKTLPEDSLTRKLGLNYAPPEMFGGKDRHGNLVKPKSLEEFEQDIINKVKYGRNDNESAKTKELAEVKKQVEEMAALFKMQASTQLQSEEERLTSQIQQARDEGDFDVYDKLIAKRSDLQQKQSQFTPDQKETKIEIKQPIQYTSEETEAIQDFRYSNKDFVQTVASNSQITRSFDDFAMSIAKNRSDLSPKEILAFAKESTERMFPNFFTKQNNVFMNNQYSATSNNSFQKKPETSKLVFENLSPKDQRFVTGEARNHPGKSYQQIAELLFNKYQPKKN